MALSGFPEWLPAGRQIELAITDTARSVFELHGLWRTQASGGGR